MDATYENREWTECFRGGARGGSETRRSRGAGGFSRGGVEHFVKRHRAFREANGSKRTTDIKHERHREQNGSPRSAQRTCCTRGTVPGAQFRWTGSETARGYIRAEEADAFFTRSPFEEAQRRRAADGVQPSIRGARQVEEARDILPLAFALPDAAESNAGQQGPRGAGYIWWGGGRILRGARLRRRRGGVLRTEANPASEEARGILGAAWYYRS
ncbi:hypothetical protein B0H17DRAFT_1183636 [Mycena rosella]|uniref:Uncharacterized protein n=1 Tax=Mycena rosella TaxID=1033263 RepID=A0AAD7D319_MYCRO|nr:hypothetical protein B0H17DRAFT_1183636 [Mycena rosella]